jgi:hypothetical protein
VNSERWGLFSCASLALAARDLAMMPVVAITFGKTEHGAAQVWVLAHRYPLSVIVCDQGLVRACLDGQDEFAKWARDNLGSHGVLDLRARGAAVRSQGDGARVPFLGETAALGVHSLATT